MSFLNLKPAEARRLTYILILGLIGALLLAWGGPAAVGERRPPAGKEVLAPAPDAIAAHERALAEGLRAVLSQVEGAGPVAVRVTLESGPGQVVAVDGRRDSRSSSERDPGGGSRTLSETTESNQMVLLRGSGGDAPVVLRQERPRIAGVLVVAPGARDSRVRARLAEAAAVALGVPMSRISVLPKAGE